MRKLFTQTALAVASLVALSAPAHAYVIVSFADTTSPLTATRSCNTNMAQDNTNATTNCSNFGGGFTGYAAGVSTIGFSGTVGSFFLQNSMFNNFPGNPVNGFNLNTENIFTNNDAGAQTLTVDVQIVGFTAPINAVKNLFGSATVNPVGAQAPAGTATASFFLDANQINCTTSMNMAAAGSCNAITTPFVSGIPYSLRSFQTFANVSGGGDSFNATANVSVTVPEPMTTALVGTALVALALTSRRRKSAQA